MSRAAVFGAGSWGTAFAVVLADAGTTPTLYGRRREVVDAINDEHENRWYQPGIRLPETVRATTDVEEALDRAEIIFFAVPAQTLRENVRAWAPYFPPRALLVSLIKGVELHTTERMSEVIREVADVATEHVAVVSGPNLAREIAERQPSASVVACSDLANAELLQSACQTAYFRPYTNTDVVGCELAGTVKNVIAVAVGMADGMGLGDNSKASLITRGLAETARLGVALGADPLTFAGLAGLGDLVATCSSQLSRNHSVGVRLGSGMSVTDALAATTTTAEGIVSSHSILELARKHDIDMPITEVVVEVLDEQLRPSEGVARLMSRAAKPERHVG
jgi:glycerol-3-phosphate dehydrogenase (NAD(P)+)